MGTDPINGFKMVQMVLDSANQFQQYGQKSARPILWNNTNWLSKAEKKPNETEKTVDYLQS